MNREEAIKLANDMAFMASIWVDDKGNEVNDLVKFAQLVADKEREACAIVCEELAELSRTSDTDSMWEWGECAAAIRARGNV